MSALKSRFNAAVELLKRKAELKNETDAWRNRATAEGLVPSVLLELAKEYRQDEYERRKAAERAEIRALYRKGLDLPLFTWGRVE